MIPLLIGLFGFGLIKGINGEVHRLERLAAADLAARLGGPDKWVEIRSELGPEVVWGDVFRVTMRGRAFTANGLPLHTEPHRSQAGHIRHLDMDFSDFVLRGLRIAHLSAKIEDSRFDLTAASRHHEFRITRSGVGRTEVAVLAPDLAAFIMRKYPQLSGVTVRFEREKIFVEGHGDFAMLAANFSVVGKLVPTAGTQLTLVFPRISINGFPANPLFAKAILNVLNPVVDLDRDLGLEGAVNLDHLALDAGVMTATGSTKIPIQSDANLWIRPPATALATVK